MATRPDDAACISSSDVTALTGAVDGVCGVWGVASDDDSEEPPPHPAVTARDTTRPAATMGEIRIKSDYRCIGMTM